MFRDKTCLDEDLAHLHADECLDNISWTGEQTTTWEEVIGQNQKYPVINFHRSPTPSFLIYTPEEEVVPKRTSSVKDLG